jgi:hypothetical protein
MILTECIIKENSICAHVKEIQYSSEVYDVDNILDAITPCLKEHGYSEEEIEKSFNELHRLNEGSGIYD